MTQVFLKKELWKRYCQHLFLALFLLAFILGLLYVYFMNFAVLKTVERNSNLKKLSGTKREIQNLEMLYINKADELNITYAKSLGFVESEPVNYIYKPKAVVRVDNYGQNFR